MGAFLSKEVNGTLCTLVPTPFCAMISSARNLQIACMGSTQTRNEQVSQYGHMPLGVSIQPATLGRNGSSPHLISLQDRDFPGMTPSCHSHPSLLRPHFIVNFDIMALGYDSDLLQYCIKIRLSRSLSFLPSPGLMPCSLSLDRFTFIPESILQVKTVTIASLWDYNDTDSKK